MVRVTKFGGLVFSVLAIATSGCSSASTNVDHAAGGNIGTSGNQGGGASTSGGTGGTGNATGGAVLVGGTTSTGTNGGTNGAGASSTATASGGATSGGATSGTTPNSGEVLVVSVLNGENQLTITDVGASFYAGTLKRCSSQTFGDCIYYTNCSQPSTYVSAGTLTITSPATATLPANNIAMVPNADNSYTYAGLSGTFAGGESVHIAASGATVPAFSVDLTAPLALLINSPATDNYGSIQASKSSDFVIQFSRGTAGVTLVALPLDFETSTEYVECTSEPGASSLTIPKAALAVAGPVLSLLTVATKQIVAGDYAVSAGINMNAFTPDKQHPVTIEIN